MKETRKLIHKYNGIREDIDKLHERVEWLEKQREKRKASRSTEEKIKDTIRDWAGWIVAAIMLLLKLIEIGVI